MDDQNRILLASEVQAVLADLEARTNKNSATNLILFRLSCCCGLRRKEICGLDMRDVVIDGPRPFIHVRKEITKGQDGKRRARKVPLWWDSGTREAISAWRESREGQGALSADPFVVKCRAGEAGERFKEQGISRRWFTALKVLGPGRVSQLTIHSGRHSFVSHSLNAGRSLVEVQKAAGHANVATTSIYLHLIEREGIPDVFQREDTQFSPPSEIYSNE